MILSRLITKMYILLCMHFLGDFILQTDFIARNKNISNYYMLIHCCLYALPFSLYFGINWKLAILLFLHFVIDTLKVHDQFDFVYDQIIHIFTIVVLYLYIQ